MTPWYPPAPILRALQTQPIEPAAGTGGLLLQAAALMRPELRNPPFATMPPR
jgi:hypothetical protein